MDVLLSGQIWAALDKIPQRPLRELHHDVFLHRQTPGHDDLE